MSFLTVFLVSILTLTLGWLVLGAVSLSSRRGARRLGGSVETTASELFDRWSKH